MKLWLLDTDYTGWDCASGFVVRAETENEARKFAAGEHGDEGEQAWLDPTQSMCVELTSEGEVGVILRDFTTG